MRGLILSVLAVVLVGGTLRAQTGGLPPGNYQQTCRDIRSNNNRLDASCQRNDGSWNNTWLDYSSCGAVVNDDGNLRCASGSTSQGLPPGNYQQTCRDIRSNNNRLDASCQRNDGSWANTWLDYGSCNGSIINDDGNLRCASGGTSPGGVPSGSYQQTCRDIRGDGNTLNATCQKKDGTWNNTSLNHYNDCRGQIENDDGNLRCR
jgi:major membrane immunogen (membrane-anchored lipoprotein)